MRHRKTCMFGMKMDVTGKTGVPVFTNTPTCKIELTAMKIVAKGIDTAKDHGNKRRSLHRQEDLRSRSSRFRSIVDSEKDWSS